MKKVLASVLAFLVCLQASAQTPRSWKMNFGLDFGLPIGGLRPFAAPDNPLVQGGATLEDGFGISGGALSRITWSRKKSNGNVVPSLSIELKATFSKFSSTATGVFPTYEDQTISIKELQFPLLFKFCILSKESDVEGTRDPDKYVVREGAHDNEYEVYVYPGQFHPGYRTTISIFPYVGPQMGFIRDAVMESSNGGYRDGFNSVKSHITDTDLSLVAGIQFMMGRGYFDFGHQQSLQSIYNGADVVINGWTGRFGFVFR